MCSIDLVQGRSARQCTRVHNLQDVLLNLDLQLMPITSISNYSASFPTMLDTFDILSDFALLMDDYDKTDPAPLSLCVTLLLKCFFEVQ